MTNHHKMAPTTCLLFFSLTLFFVGGAQVRVPHGLVYENPMAFSPSAVEFFHPKAKQVDTKSPCETSSSCSPLPVAAQLEAVQAQDSEVITTQKGGSRLGAGGIAAIVFGVAFAVLLAMGAYYALITRRGNLSRANSVPSA